MDTPEEVFAKVQKLIDNNPKYKLEAYGFILSALHFTLSKISPPRHISGREFCEGIRQYALEQFGPMTKSVLEYWGIEQTKDFGHLVFALVEVGLMRKTEEDSLADFTNVYDFKTAFDSKQVFE